VRIASKKGVWGLPPLGT